MPDKYDQYVTNSNGPPIPVSTAASPSSEDKYAQYITNHNAAPPKKPDDGSAQTPQDGWRDKLGHLAEDVMYPTLGAAAGVALTAETGPGMLAGGALGATEGNELKREMRHLRGRDDLNPQGMGQVTDDALAAAGGGMQAYGKMAEATPTILQDAKPGVGRVVSWIQNHLRANPSTSGMMSNMLDKPTNQIVLNTGHQLADEIASHSLESDPQALGNAIKGAADSVQKNAGELYGNALKTITAQGADQIPIRLQLPKGVQDTARQMLADLQGNRGDFADVFKDAQDRNLAIHTLQQFAEPTTPAVASKVLGVDGKPIMIPGQVKELPWNGARTLASDLDAVIRGGNQTIGKGGLSQLKQALQDSMQSSLNEHNPGLGTAFRNASTNYAKVQDAMSSTVIQRLLENNSPELAAKYLLQGGNTLSKTQALQQAIGTQGQKTLAGSVLKQMLTDATDTSNSTLKTPRLLKQWNSLTPEVKQMLFPDPKHFAAVDRFMQTADKTALPIKSMTAGQMAQGGSVTIPLLPEAVGKYLPKVHIDPEFAAKLLSHADSADQLASALTTKAGTLKQRQALGALIQTMHEQPPSQ